MIFEHGAKAIATCSRRLQLASLKLSIKYQCCGGSLQCSHQKNIRFDCKRLRSPCSAADAVSEVLLEEARRDIKIFLPLFIYRALHLKRVWADIIVCKLTTTCVQHWSQKIYNFPIVSVQHCSTCFPRKLQTALCMRPTLVN